MIIPWIGDIISSNFNITKSILEAYDNLTTEPASPFLKTKYGAYILRHHWKFHNEKNIILFSDGFLRGYEYAINNLNNDKRVKRLETKAKRCYEFMKWTMLYLSDAFANSSDISDWYKIGYTYGRFYASWIIIMDNYSLFDKYF